jgi:type II secretory ATPase GspE/PulE/Tfp pilus assembly ATPase PilB-like protein
VRRACPHCTRPVRDDAFADAVAQRLGRAIPSQRPTGCEACHGTGYVGRLGIFEVLPVGPATAPRVARGAGAAEIRQAAREHGMLSVFDTGLGWVEAGTTTLDEIRRAVPARIIAEWLSR